MPHYYNQILFQVLPLLGIVLVIFLVRSKAGGTLNTLKEICSSLGGQLVNGNYVFTKEGKLLTLKYIPGSRNQKPEIVLLTSGMFAGQVLIRQRTAWDNFYKIIGLNQEIPVSDLQLSEKFYFECDSPQFLNQLLSSSEVKSLIQQCLNNFTFIDISANACAARKSPGLLKDIKKEEIDTVSSLLVKLVSFVPTGIIPVTPEYDSFKIWSGVLVILPSILPMATFFLGIWATHSFKVIEIFRSWFFAAWVGIAVLLAVSSFVFLMVRGFSASSKIFVPFFFTFALCSVFIVRFAGAVFNGSLDKSQVNVIDTVVIDKNAQHGKYGLNYYAILKPWRSGMNNWKVEVKEGKKVYDQIQPGFTHCKVFTKPGYLGFEWIAAPARLQLYGSQRNRVISDFDKIIFSSADTHNNQGVVYFNQGDLDQALDSFSKAIAIDSDFTKAYRNRAIVYFKLKEYDESWADVHKLQDLGVAVDPILINALKKVTGQ